MTLLEALKFRTKTQHDALERANVLPRNRADYLAWLQLFYGFVEPWEERLTSVLNPEDPVISGRLKTPWLVDDLAYFGVTGSALLALPRCSSIPAATTREVILGGSYVVEGSTLGGQVIARHLQAVLGLSAGRGYRFFCSYGAEVGLRWKTFRDELARHSSPQADEQIIEAAERMFSSFHAWFLQSRHALPT